LNLNKQKFCIGVILFFIITWSVCGEQTIRAGHRYEPQTMDPAEVWDDTSSFYIVNIFDRLVEIDPENLKVRPSLATEWESNREGTVWKFRLRRGVLFHDGTPFNADAVVFSFNRQLQNRYKYGEFVLFKEVFPYLKYVKKSGEYEVEFGLSESFFPFPATLSVDCASIVSPTALIQKKEQFRKAPVGTGAYRFVSWKEGKQVELKSNPEYWRGKPPTDRFIAIIDKNLDRLMELFKNQEIDILTNYSISKMVVLKGFSWVGYSYASALSTSYIAFNMKNRFLKRLRVRQALNYLWNKDILKLVFQGHVEPLCSLFPKGMQGYDCNMDNYPINVKKARLLLKKEGLGKGFELTFLIIREQDISLQLVDIFSRNLKKVGIRLKMDTVDSDTYFSRVKKGEYDLTLSSWIADYPDPFSIIKPLFSRRIQNEGFANFATGEGNEDIIRMISRSRTIRDPEKRERFYLKLNELVVKRALLIPLYQDIHLVLYNKRIGKVKLDRFGKLSIFGIRKK